MVYIYPRITISETDTQYYVRTWRPIWQPAGRGPACSCSPGPSRAGRHTRWPAVDAASRRTANSAGDTPDTAAECRVTGGPSGTEGSIWWGNEIEWMNDWMNEWMNEWINKKKKKK